MFRVRINCLETISRPSKRFRIPPFQDFGGEVGEIECVIKQCKSLKPSTLLNLSPRRQIPIQMQTIDASGLSNKAFNFFKSLPKRFILRCEFHVSFVRLNSLQRHICALNQKPCGFNAIVVIGLPVVALGFKLLVLATQNV